MQKVIAIVRKTFADTIDAIDGSIIMTPNILDAINAVKIFFQYFKNHIKKQFYYYYYIIIIIIIFRFMMQKYL